jgi:hypothetical protein
VRELGVLVACITVQHEGERGAHVAVSAFACDSGLACGRERAALTRVALSRCTAASRASAPTLAPRSNRRSQRGGRVDASAWVQRRPPQA